MFSIFPSFVEVFRFRSKNKAEHFLEKHFFHFEYGRNSDLYNFFNITTNNLNIAPAMKKIKKSYGSEKFLMRK